MEIESLNDLKSDFFSSIVVFLVAMPLCLGIALASGFSVSAGIISGIIGGIVVGSIAGCPLQVSGPAASLILISYEMIQLYGFEKFGVIVFVAGLFQLILGTLKLGQWFRAVSPAIILGMLSGIGVSILFSQFHIMIDEIPKGTVLTNILSIPKSILNCFFSASNNGHAWAAIIGILTIGIILLWNYVPSRLKVLPSALVAVIISTLIAYALNLPIKYISIPPNIFEGIKFLSLSSFSCIFDYKIIIAAISITFIASAETLISAAAIDKITKYSKTNYNREILSQGIGNILAGFFCVLPLTGVIVRSAANVHSGAVTRKSTILHGIWLLLFILCLPFVLKLVPTACLAALLVYTGYKLIELQEAKKIYMLSKGEFIIFLITVLAVIATNFLDGILIGISASFIKNIYKSFKSTINIEYSNENKIVTIKMIGNLTFIKLPQITNMIEKIEPKKQIVIDFNRLSYIDHACIDILLDWAEQYKRTGGEITIDWEPVKVIYPSFGWDNVVKA